MYPAPQPRATPTVEPRVGITNGAIIQLSLRGTMFSQRILNILHYVVISPGTSGTVLGQLQDLVDTLANDGDGGLLISKFLATQSASYSLDSIRAQVVDPTRSPFAENTAIQVGTAAGTSNTANVAVSITKKSDVGGRHGIGRMQLAGVPSSQIASGRVQGAFAAGPLKALADALKFNIITAPSNVTMEPVIYNPGVVPFNYSQIIQTTVQDTVRTMHRRTLFVGE